MKTGTNNLSTEELKEANDAMDLFSFEKYCGSCDNFPGDLGVFNVHEYDGPVCPFRTKFLDGKLNCETEWKLINCDKYWN